MLRTSRSAHHKALMATKNALEFQTSRPMGQKQYRFHCGTNRLTEWVLYRTHAPVPNGTWGMWTGGGV